ncbi:GPN-loop GTPase 2 [Aphelenchoides besseyi]|nr:GPN-loop GTPase 2 [Aphelenchoides besseyi]KAI6207637.1 GPN-loop GTPase 2 [Aphelenchoides besseyi]
MILFGQIVVGAPGSGKTTYCGGLIQILQQLERPIVYVNLDPANDILPCPCDLDIRDLITVEDAMQRLDLGPNGALRYCMKTLADNFDWLRQGIQSKEGYLIIDMPGQLELYNSDDSITKITRQLQAADCRLCAVHLSDSMYCSDAGKFVAVILSALSITINLELPQVNVLSKADLLPSDLPYNADYYRQLPDLKHLTDLLDDHPVLSKYKDLCSKLCEVADQYNYVNFRLLDVSSKEKMVDLLQAADKSNGFAFYDVEDLREILSK